MPPGPRILGPDAVEEGVDPRHGGVALVGDELEQPAADTQLSDHASPSESAGRGGCVAGHPASEDGRLLANLAGIDELVLERDVEWKGLAQHLDALRREIAVTSARLQRSRSLAARKPSRDDDGGQGRSPAPTREEERAPQLMLKFEARLRETEVRRIAFQAEMDDLRRRRQALLQRLPASVSGAYQSLAAEGRLPVIAPAVKGACGGCESPLPDSIIEALSHGAAAACAHCERLLHLARRVE